MVKATKQGEGRCKPDFYALAADWLSIEAVDGQDSGQMARLSALLASVYADGEAEAIERCAKECDDTARRVPEGRDRTSYMAGASKAGHRIRALLPGAKP